MRKNIESESPRKPNTKKKIIVAIAVVAIIMIALFAVSFFIDKYYSSKSAEEGEEHIDYDFAPIDYEKNIFEDERYISLTENGFLYYKDSSTGVTLGIERDSAATHGAEVAFMVEYIYTIINGDNEAYNRCFSKEYFENKSPKDKYTMQMLYDVNIVKISAEEVSVGDTVYNEYTFALEYRILDNNGSFRSDIGSGTKTQYITLTDRHGKLLIDSIATAKIAR